MQMGASLQLRITDSFGVGGKGVVSTCENSGYTGTRFQQPQELRGQRDVGNTHPREDT